MAMTIHVDIVSAEGEIHSGQAQMVYAPAVMGELGVAPRHAPLVTKLKPGEVRVDEGGPEMKHFYVSGGVIEVQPHLTSGALRTVCEETPPAPSQFACLYPHKRLQDPKSRMFIDFMIEQCRIALKEILGKGRAKKRSTAAVGRIAKRR